MVVSPGFKKCDNVACRRPVSLLSMYCCGGCSLAAEGKYDPDGYHSTTCEERFAKRSLPPGSDAAVEKGCLCPVFDNHRGEGYLGGIKDVNGDTIYVTREGCPLHWPKP